PRWGAAGHPVRGSSLSGVSRYARSPAAAGFPAAVVRGLCEPRRLATNTRKRYLIIGNGASGTYAAETIRKTDTEGEITLLTNEPYPLYNRVALPPFLRDEARREKVFLRTPEQHAHKGIKRRCETQITELDTKERFATAADGQPFPYDRLLIATGGRPKHLPAPGATPDVQGIYNFQYF